MLIDGIWIEKLKIEYEVINAIFFLLKIFNLPLNATESERVLGEVFSEVGAGFSMLDIPHYVGSEQSEIYALPFPYFYYQSDNVSLNREGLKRHLIDSSRWNVDFSLSGSPPLKSKDNQARQNMPDLDWVGLAGPVFNYRLYQNDKHLLQLTLSTRLGLATDFSQFNPVGWETDLGLLWNTRISEAGVVWKIMASADLNYASQQYNDCYYSVDKIYTTNTRAEYQAKEGFGGYKLTFGINRREGRFWMGAFVRYRNLSGASFIDSPLITTKQNYYTGIAFAWIMKFSRN